MTTEQTHDPTTPTHERRGLCLAGGLLVLVELVTVSLAACHGSERPANHPVSSIQTRAAMRVGLVSLVVPEQARAERVEALYREIDELARDLEATRSARLGELRRLDTRRDADDAEFRSLLAALRDDGTQAFRRYVALQVALRGQLTPEEFERLDATR